MKKKEFDILIEDMADRIDAAMELAQPPKFNEFVKHVVLRLELILTGAGPEFGDQVALDWKFDHLNDPEIFATKFLELWGANSISAEFDLVIATDASWVMLEVLEPELQMN